MRLFTLALVASCLVTGCGKKSGSSDGSDIVPGSEGLHDGTEGVIYTDSHPADCGTCTPAPVVPAASCSATIGQNETCEGSCFVEDSVSPTYEHNPPSSGPMYDAPDWTWYESTTPIPRGTYVRNLAHGFVVVVYNCPGGCDSDLQILRQALNNEPGWPWLLTPDPQFNVPGQRFGMVSWTWQYTFDIPNAADIDCFVQQHSWQGIVQ